MKRAVIDYWRSLRRSSRDAKLFLVATTLVSFAVFSGIYPVLFNLYILRLGYGPDFVGLINSLNLLGYAIGCLPAGVLCQRCGVRRTLIWGMWSILIGYGLQPLAEVVPVVARDGWLVISGLVGNLGLALFLTASHPLMMRVTALDERNHVYSARSALSLAAGVVGGLVGGWLPPFFSGGSAAALAQAAPYSWGLLCGAALLVPGLFAVHRLDVRLDQKPCDETSVDRQATRGGPWAVGLVIGLLALVDLLVLSSEGAGRTFFNVYLDAGLAVPVERIGMMVAMAQLMAIPTVMAMPSLARHWGNGTLVLLNSLAMAAGVGVIALTRTWLGAAIGYVVLLAAAQARVSTSPVFQMSQVPVRAQPIMAAVAGVSLGLCWSLTSAAGGIAIQRYGYAPFFWAVAAVALAGTALFGGYMAWRRRDRDVLI